ILAARARDILKRTGHSEPGADSAFGFMPNEDYGDYVTSHKNANGPAVPGSRALLFWRRQSPRPLETVTFSAGPTVQTDDPPIHYPGETMVVLDSDGRLASFRAIPPQQEPSVTATDPDWTFLLSEAGLDASKWKPVEPQFNPLSYADNRIAWQGTLP